MSRRNSPEILIDWNILSKSAHRLITGVLEDIKTDGSTTSPQEAEAVERAVLKHVHAEVADTSRSKLSNPYLANSFLKQAQYHEESGREGLASQFRILGESLNAISHMRPTGRRSK